MDDDGVVAPKQQSLRLYIYATDRWSESVCMVFAPNSAVADRYIRDSLFAEIDSESPLPNYFLVGQGDLIDGAVSIYSLHKRWWKLPPSKGSHDV